MHSAGHDGWQLDAERYLATATEQTGLDDFGSERFLSDYSDTVGSLNEESDFSAFGLAAVEDHMVRLLVNRLRMHRDLKRHPEIEAQVLAPPIVITGFPRTGSTKLQRMLSASPDLQALLSWQMFNVAPFPAAVPGQPDPRIPAALAADEAAKSAFPEVWATHPTPALDADEDFRLHELTFRAPTLPMRLGAPRLMDRLTPLSDHVYQELRTTLKYLQWQHGGAGSSERPFVLKSPVHIGSLTSLLKEFPGTRVIQCHRAIEISIVSTVNMMDFSKRIFLNSVDAHETGREVMNYWAREWERNLEQRLDIDPAAILDVSFAEINADAIRAIERIYAFVGLPMTTRAREAMLRWEDENRRHKHGTRSYSAADYDLTDDQIRQACSAYLARFGDASDLLGTRESAS